MDDKQHNSANAASETARDDGSARSRLMEAATKLFAVQGLAGTSTRDIAKAADLNISLISYYFGGKEGLYKAVLTEFAHRMQMESEKAFENFDFQNLTRESFQTIMRALVLEMIPIKLSNREIHILLQREMMAGFPHSKDIYENVFSKILEKFVGIYETGQKKGFVRKDINPYVIFLSLVHSSDSYLLMNECHTSINGRIPKLPEQINDYGQQLYRIFVEGVLI